MRRIIARNNHFIYRKASHEFTPGSSPFFGGDRPHTGLHAVGTFYSMNGHIFQEISQPKCRRRRGPISSPGD